eukprot:SAG25_NODE_2926_length_1311_cov_1.436469_1_plen_98_part_10
MIVLCCLPPEGTSAGHLPGRGATGGDATEKTGETVRPTVDDILGHMPKVQLERGIALLLAGRVCQSDQPCHCQIQASNPAMAKHYTAAGRQADVSSQM